MENILKDNSEFKINYRNKTDGILLMKDIKDESLKVAFFDPQYRGVLDYMNYGTTNRQLDRESLTQMPEETIIGFFNELNRIIKPSGYLFLWLDKFHLTNGDYHNWYKDTDFHCVDMVTWNKGKIGMGYRMRCKSEFCYVLQKKPTRVKGTWSLHNIPDVWEEKVVKNHPHSKPIELQKVLIESTTEPNDFVLDPASGGYSVFRACKETNRNFIGGDIEFGELEFNFGEKK